MIVSRNWLSDYVPLDAPTLPRAEVTRYWWAAALGASVVALGVTLHSIPDEDIADNWSGGSVAVRFSATMN